MQWLTHAVSIAMMLIVVLIVADLLPAPLGVDVEIDDTKYIIMDCWDLDNENNFVPEENDEP